MGDAADPVRDPRKTFIVPGIRAFDHYDFSRAKTVCSLSWLVAKAFGTDHVPEELVEPFYTDQYDQEHIKPPVVNLLLSAELYCRAGSLILKSDAAKPLLGHDAVVQALAQKGLYVTEQEKLVTERDLRKKPIQMAAHVAMIDTLMMAYTVEMISIEKVVSCIQQFTNFFPATDLPYDIEDAIMCWINKVNGHLKEIINQEQRSQASEPPGGQRARYRKDQALPKQLPCIPSVENLLKDTTDGCTLTALIHFYCPDVIRMEDICLKETMSLADGLYNLQLIQDFCQGYLNQCCHFTLEDMLYASSSIKNNYLVFMAELFWWFEVVKPPFVQPRVVCEVEGKCLKHHSCWVIHCRASDSDDSRSVRNGYFILLGMMRRSTSLSYVEGYAGTWPEKKPRSSPQAVAFCIPFDSENNLDISTPNNRPIIRSISNDSLVSNLNNTPKRLMRNSSFQPINGQNDGIEEEMHLPNHTDKSPKSSTKRHGLGNPRRRSMHDTVLNGPIENISDLDDYSNNIGPPSIEEALQIIHDVDKSSDLQSEQLTDGFFLHLKNSSDMPVKPKMNQASSLDSIAEIKGIVSPMTDNTEVDTGIHVPSEDIQETMDEDSSLRDYTVSMDSDLEDPSKPHDTDITNSNYKCLPTPLANSLSTALHVGNAISPGSAIKMTSFAEQKFRKLNHTDPRLSGSSSQKTTPESSELNTPGVVSWGQTPELSPLRQTRDTAQLLASEMVQLKMKLEEKRRAIEAQKKKVEAAFTRQRQKMGRTAFLHVVRKKADGICTVKEELGDESEKSSQQKKVSKVEPIDENEELKIEEVGMNCNSADGIKRDLDELHTQGLKSPTTPVDSEKQVSWNLASPSEEAIGEAEIVEYNRLIEKMNTALHALQQEMQRLAQQQEVIMHMREPQQAWVISPPQPSPQKQVRELRSSSRSTGKPAYPHVKNSRTTRPSELKITPLNRVLSLPRSVDSLPHLRKFSPSQVQTRSFIFLGDDGEKQSDHHSKQNRVELWFAQMPSVSREASVDFPDSPVKKKEPPNQTPKAGLIEVSLSDLKPSEEETELDETNEGDADREHFEEDQKLCCGFFFKDDQKAEDDIAVKRAALLEKRMRREKEKQVRRQQLEAELEEKKEETRRKAEEERQKKEDERARREFIKQEYLRKKQLKLMQDMDSVIKPRPTTLKLKKARPKSFREDGEHRRTPVRSSEGTWLSSLSLASLNLAETDHTHSGKRTPRTESVEGSVSPSCNASHSGEKDWENGSTTSSVASATEYTGPKLYKEPSAKSNKHIIQNAISHCCLAGRVNENQKNKILAEIEKSEANHFLILFRDPACQFRALYTYSLETEEIVKLAGIGPKGIGKKMIEGLYKYNSDRKQFSNIPAKTISASVDAIIIHGHLWQNKRPGTPKKLTPSKS
uniref:Calmodulin regulated spectrin-associated protein family, member 2a n=1 Tax=Callorhinchus milii TaxID=7868 RepID=A0A4W3I6V1_CALMI